MKTLIVYCQQCSNPIKLCIIVVNIIGKKMALEDKNLKSDLKKKATNNSVDEELKIAQILDESELNNLSNSSNLESLSPEENIEESPGVFQKKVFPENNNQHRLQMIQNKL